MPPVLGKRKAQREELVAFRLEMCQIYGCSSQVATEPATTGSVDDEAPPLSEEDDPARLAEDRPPETRRVISARRKSKKGDTKGVRGVVNNTKASDIVKVNGKIVVDYDSHLIMGPRKSKVCSLFVNSVGSILRSKVSMTKESWAKQPRQEMKKLFDGLTCYYEIDFNNEDLVLWIHKRAESIYKEWKHDLFKVFSQGGRNEVIAEELLHRQDEWDWLCSHFESDEYKV